MRLRALVGLLFLDVACGAGPTSAVSPPSAAPVPVAVVAPPTPPGCPSAPDVADLLRRHARAFGDARIVATELPRFTRSDVTIGGKKGEQRVLVDRRRLRVELRFGTLTYGMGQDDEGYWELGAAGVVVRLEPAEAVASAARGWVERRAYLSEYRADRDEFRCVEADDGPRLIVRYDLPLLGWPMLQFDLASGTLLAMRSTWADGQRMVTLFKAWSEADDRGVRWPTEIARDGLIGTEQEHRGDATSHLGSAGGSPSAPAPPSDFAPPGQALELVWPTAPVVRVPLRRYLNELSLRVKVGGREVWAALDSGAGTTALDTGSPVILAFRPDLQTTGTGSTESFEAGLGSVDELVVGGGALRHLPVATVPMPVLDHMGDRRPELLVGASLFFAAAVRVDYRKGELKVARSADALRSPGAVAVPVRLTNGKVAVEMNVAGHEAWVDIDTGSASGLDLASGWAKANELPGALPFLENRILVGAGLDATTQRAFRLGEASLGPISYHSHLVDIVESPVETDKAGSVGNDLLSRCAAIVFDVRKRTLWLEPPCDIDQPESLAGWRLTKDAKGHADRPWVLEAVYDGGAAALLGLKVGDRILEVGGVAATLDCSRVDDVTRRPAGTRVSVAYQRDGATVRGTMTLRPLLPVAVP